MPPSKTPPCKVIHSSSHLSLPGLHALAWHAFHLPACWHGMCASHACICACALHAWQQARLEGSGLPISPSSLLSGMGWRRRSSCVCMCLYCCHTILPDTKTRRTGTHASMHAWWHGMYLSTSPPLGLSSSPPSLLSSPLSGAGTSCVYKLCLFPLLTPPYTLGRGGVVGDRQGRWVVGVDMGRRW